jgi:hypothetical protein
MCQALFEGPVDVVGDVHGEFEALDQLLDVLGYHAENGWKHPEGRRLVFVGDLVDRGPNSPGVVERVMELAAAGVAQCVLGNHELNILRGEEHKEGNGWFFGHIETKFKTAVQATDEQRERFRAFFDAMPLALVREDLRIVHAAWNDATMRETPTAPTPVEWYQRAEKELKSRLEADGLGSRVRAAKTHLPGEDSPPPDFNPDIAHYDSERQNGNPVGQITSGREEPLVGQAPFHRGGKWRFVSRAPWWNALAPDVCVVFGHYWRSILAAEGGRDPDQSNPLAHIDGLRWLGPHRNAFCVDYCAGVRYQGREKGMDLDRHFPLVAIQLPAVVRAGENHPLVANDGTVRTTRTLSP